MTASSALYPPPPPTRRRRRSKAGRLSGNSPVRRIGIVGIWLFVAFNVALLLWVIVQAFRSTREIFGNPWGLPSSINFDNFVDAWTAMEALLDTGVSSSSRPCRPHR